jgi:hypothetical protein
MLTVQPPTTKPQLQPRRCLVPILIGEDGSRWVPQRELDRVVDTNSSLAVRCTRLADQRNAARREADAALKRLTEATERHPWWRSRDARWVALVVFVVALVVVAGMVAR